MSAACPSPPHFAFSVPSHARGSKRKARRHRSASRAIKQRALYHPQDSMVLCDATTDSTPSVPTVIGDLPDEILVHIMGHLPCMDRRYGGASSVSHQWRRIALDQKTRPRAACGRYFYEYDPFMSAVESFHVDCIEYGLERGWVRTADACAEAIERGHFDLAMRFHRKYECAWETSKMVVGAARSGRLDILKDLCAARAKVDGTGICDAAAAGGHLPCLQYAHESGFDWGVGTTRAAAAGGHLNCLDYLFRSGCPWNEKAITAAIDGDTSVCGRYIDDNTARRMACLRYLVANGCAWPERGVTYTLVRAGSKWFTLALELGCPFDVEDCYDIEVGFTIRSRDTAMVRLLTERGYEWSKGDLIDIIKTDGIDMFDALLDAGAPWDLDMAARLAYLQEPRFMQWMLDRGLVWDVQECLMTAITSYGGVDRWIIDAAPDCPRLAKFCLRAATHQRHEILEYMLARGFPWDPVAGRALLPQCSGRCLVVLARAGLVGPGPWPESADMCAAVAGDRYYGDDNVDDIRLFYALGHHADARSTAAAAGVGFIKVLRWLVEQGCPVDSHALVMAARSGRVDCLRYLCEMGYACNSDTYQACVEGGSVACVTYLDQIGCRRSVNAALSVARSGRADMLRYLHQTGAPLHPIMCTEAVKGGNVACLRYLRGRGYLTNLDACLEAANSSASCKRYLEALRPRRACETTQPAPPRP